jgi:hypothetical protein
MDSATSTTVGGYTPEDAPEIVLEELNSGKYRGDSSVPKLHVRHLFGRVRPRTWRFEGFLDRTIIIF